MGAVYGIRKDPHGGRTYDGPLRPILEQRTVSLPPPDLEDQRSDEHRLLDALPEGIRLEKHTLRAELPRLVREADRLTVTLCGKEITAVAPGDRPAAHYALAVDIGTTTVVAYLLDLSSGKIAATASGLNPQKSFGGDVVSRIEYIGEDAEKLNTLQQRILGQIEDFFDETLGESGLAPADISGIFLAGNTTMMHIFSGLNPRYLAVAPFIPVTTGRVVLSPGDIGSRLPPHLRFILLPSLSAYIGADILAGILSTGMSETEELCLLVDIGTNGEIALGNKDRIITCSTAAGPAFEGANIQCGTGGIPGAISAVKGNRSPQWETIGNRPALGICGSGIIDTAAYLLRTGIADYTGRFTDESDWGDKPPENLDGLIRDERDSRFLLSRGEKEIFFSQKDLREVQLAKGSIAAGIRTLIAESGRPLEEIQHVYLAGGFGSYIDKQSALEVGLLPAELEDRIRSVGNSCGAGVIRAALNRDDLEKCDRIRETTEYLELSAHKGFQEEYILNMYFPQKD